MAIYSFNKQAKSSQNFLSKWFLSIGMLLSLLGLLAIISSFTATKIAMMMLGIILLFAGLARLLQALFHGGVENFISGACYSVVGLALIVDPVDGAIGLTLLIGLLLFASGAMRLIAAISALRFGLSSGWHFGVGVLTIVFALLILTGWPETGNWLIGFVIGLELIMAGALASFAISGIRR